MAIIFLWPMKMAGVITGRQTWQLLPPPKWSERGNNYRPYSPENYLTSTTIPTGISVFQSQRDLSFFHWQYALQQQPFSFYNNSIEWVSGIPWIAIMQTDLKSFLCACVPKKDQTNVLLKKKEEAWITSETARQTENDKEGNTDRERKGKRVRGLRNRHTIDRSTQRWRHL